MADCKNESLLAMSGRVLTAAYWRLPITPLEKVVLIQLHFDLVGVYDHCEY